MGPSLIYGTSGVKINYWQVNTEARADKKKTIIKLFNDRDFHYRFSNDDRIPSPYSTSSIS
jgi:hypothetical protein